MAFKKRCESCKGYFNCKIYDKVCDNLEFLQNFLNIKESGDIAKYCKSYDPYTRKELRTIKSNFRYIQGRKGIENRK